MARATVRRRRTCTYVHRVQAISSLSAVLSARVWHPASAVPSVRPDPRETQRFTLDDARTSFVMQTQELPGLADHTMNVADL